MIDRIKLAQCRKCRYLRSVNASGYCRACREMRSLWWALGISAVGLILIIAYGGFA